MAEAGIDEAGDETKSVGEFLELLAIGTSLGSCVHV